MVDKDKVLTNAKQWFAQLDIPDKCPAENCRAVKKWEIGKVSKVNQSEYDKEIGRGRAIKDPEKYIVLLTCGWCGHIERAYEEEIFL
jgi:hypothetical protein